MISDIFECENRFYRECDTSRISKFLSHSKLYEMSLGLPGDFLEAGVFKGASFSRFRKLGRLFQPDHARKFYGFDVFGKFPDAEFEPDRIELERQLKIDGDSGISEKELYKILEGQGLADNTKLVPGDVRETIPKFLEENQQTSFSIVNIDLDLYEPTEVAIRFLYPRLVVGGIMILDDYEGYPGARIAANEVFNACVPSVKIQKFSFAQSPCYIIKT
jgi:hypothetical protein